MSTEEYTRLGDYLDLITYGFTNPMPDSNVGPWKITAKDINGGKINYNTARKTTQTAFDNDLTPKSKPKIGDVLLTKDGTLGHLAIADNDNLCINQSVALLRPNKDLSSDYLYYLLNSPNYQKLMLNDADGSVLKHIYITKVQEMPVNIPSLPEQKERISLIKDLDSKIDNNISLNENLMKIAKMIFDFWFLQFDFPNENGTPYMSSGGNKIFNEELDMYIPEGWTVGSLNDIAKYVNGLACQKYRPIDETQKLPVIKITEMHYGITDKTEFVRSDIDENHIINDGDILFSWSATLETMIWTGGKGGLNQHIFKVIPKDYGKYFVFMMLSAYIVNFVRMAESRKTTMGHITKDHLLRSKIPLPPKELTFKFDELVSDLFDKYIWSSIENRELTSLKDFLLPLLINGQVGFE